VPDRAVRRTDIGRGHAGVGPGARGVRCRAGGVRRGFGAGMTRAEIIARMQQATTLDRLPTLAELGNAAAFLASDRAGAMTATLANIACGAFLD
jgi:hypothetical protein